MKYVFRKRQYVRSGMFGLGQVLAEGETPLIRFLDCPYRKLHPRSPGRKMTGAVRR